MGRQVYAIEPLDLGPHVADRVIVDDDGAWLATSIPGGAEPAYIENRQGRRVPAPAGWRQRILPDR